MNTQSTPPIVKAEPSLAVSLSGGGHRATLFGLGALMYLVDAGANARVTSIASVSGGSLTNGFVGQALDFKSTDGTTFRHRVAKPLATQIARAGTLFATILSKLYVAALIIGAILVLLAAVVVPGPWYVRALVLFFGSLVWGWLLGRRGSVCARAFQKTLFSPGGHATLLNQLSKDGLDHVICATELRSAEQVYFSGDFVCSYWLGYGGPGNLALARAVQASASFPGGFPAARIPTEPHSFTSAPDSPDGPPQPPTQMVLSDGGVYDNMGDQWARGFLGRVRRWPDLRKKRPAPNQLVVVNASARVPWVPFRLGRIPLISEIALLLRVNSVMYINTTNVRRQEIVSSYNPDRPADAAGLASVLVQIAQSPFAVADAFGRGTGPAAARAKAAIEMLGEKTRDEWARTARENARVATTLSKLGMDVSARLVWQGYVVTMCNLHVIFGPEFPLLPQEVAFERFRELVL